MPIANTLTLRPTSTAPKATHKKDNLVWQDTNYALRMETGAEVNTYLTPVIYRGTTTNATPTVLYINGTSGQQFAVAATKGYGVRLQVTAKKAAAVNMGMITQTFTIANHSGTTTITTSAGNNEFDVVLGAGISLAVTTASGNIVLTATGIAATTIKWAAELWLTEIVD